MNEQSKSKVAAAEALEPILNFMRVADGQKILNLFVTKQHESLTALHLQFESHTLTLAAVSDDDSIELKSESGLPAGSEETDQHLMKSFVGKVLGWTWLTINQQGYTDGLLLSFEGVIPQIAVTAVASELKLSVIHRSEG